MLIVAANSDSFCRQNLPFDSCSEDALRLLREEAEICNVKDCIPSACLEICSRVSTDLSHLQATKIMKGYWRYAGLVAEISALHFMLYNNTCRLSLPLLWRR